jgi:uncharacterized protein involved in exopolysaccharide biosynthesis
MGQAATEQFGKTMDGPPPFREFMAHVYVRRGEALAAFMIVFLMFSAIAAMLPPHYKAAATLAVLPAPEFTVRPDAGSNQLNASALAMDQIMKAETGILESDGLHAAVLRHLGLGSVYPDLVDADPPGLVHSVLRALLSPWLGPARHGPEAMLQQALRRFESDLDVRASKDGNVIDLSFTTLDGETAARVLNDLLAQYAQRRSHLYDDPQLRVVSHEAESVRSAVAEADERLAAFKAAHAIANFTEERSMLLKRRTDTQQSLAEADISASAQQARMTALDREIRVLPKTADIFLERDTDTRLQAIDAALIDLRTRLASARVRYLDSSRIVSDLNTQIAMRLGERRNLADNPAPSVARSGPGPVTDALRLDWARACAEHDAAVAQSGALGHLLADIDSALVEYDGNERKLDELERQKQIADGNYATAARVMAERRLTEAEDNLRLANVRIIQDARAPLRPGPMKPLLVLAGVFLGLLCAAGLVVWRFAVGPTFLTAAGLAEATGLPVLGVYRGPMGAVFGA